MSLTKSILCECKRVILCCQRHGRTDDAAIPGQQAANDVRCSPRHTGASTLHVHELERKVVVLLPEQPHDLLKIIDLLASDPDLVILYGWLDLHLETLNELDDFLAGLFGDTLLDLDIHVCYYMGDKFDLLDAQAFGVHLKPDAL